MSSRSARFIKWVSRPVRTQRRDPLKKKKSLPDTFMLPSHLRTFFQVVSNGEKVHTANLNCSVIADVRQWLRALCGYQQIMLIAQPHCSGNIHCLGLPQPGQEYSSSISTQLRQACSGDGTSADIAEESYNRLLAWN